MARTLTDHDMDAPIARHIGPHPANAGLDEYWLREPGVPVWVIIGAYKAEGGNADEVAAAYHLSREQVDAALAYDRDRYGKGTAKYGDGALQIDPLPRGG